MDSVCEIFQHSGGLSINEVGRGSEWLLEDPWQSQLDNGHPSPDAARKKVIMQGRSGMDLCLAASSDGDKMQQISQFQCYTEQRIQVKGVRNDEVIDLCVVKAVNPWQFVLQQWKATALLQGRIKPGCVHIQKLYWVVIIQMVGFFLDQFSACYQCSRKKAHSR